MDQREYLLTPQGAEKLKRELEELAGPKREDLAKRLRHAISMGDLSENADYIAAKEEQAFLEGKIQELEAILSRATIVDDRGDGNSVQIGTTVRVEGANSTEEVFHLVGMKEADPREGKISNESPIGKALIGLKVGEVAMADTPAGTLEFKIIEIVR
jgi:transcription elongation factor GreA